MLVPQPQSTLPAGMHTGCLKKLIAMPLLHHACSVTTKASVAGDSEQGCLRMPGGDDKDESDPDI